MFAYLYMKTSIVKVQPYYALLLGHNPIESKKNISPNIFEYLAPNYCNVKSELRLCPCVVFFMRGHFVHSTVH